MATARSPITLCPEIAASLGIGSWSYRSDGDRLALLGCPALMPGETGAEDVALEDFLVRVNIADRDAARRFLRGDGSVSRLDLRLRDRHERVVEVELRRCGKPVAGEIVGALRLLETGDARSLPGEPGHDRRHEAGGGAASRAAARQQAAQMCFAGELASLAYWHTDAAQANIVRTQGIGRVLGRAPQDGSFRLRDILRLLHRDDRAPAMAVIADALRHHRPFRQGARILLPDGSVGHVIMLGTPAHDEHGRPGGFFGIVQNITSHKRSTDALELETARLGRQACELQRLADALKDSRDEARKALDLLRDAAAVIADGLAVFDAADRLLVCNAAFASLFGKEPQDLGGMDFARLLDLLEAIAPSRAEEGAEGWREQWIRHHHKADGEPFRLAIGSRHHLLHEHLTGTGNRVILRTDISAFVAERKAAEQRIHENQLYRQIFETLPDFLFAKDRQGRFLLANEATADVMGAHSSEVLLGKTDFDFYPPDLAARYAEDERVVIEQGDTVILEQPMRRADGSHGVLCSLKMPIHDDAGEIIGYIGHGRDITEQRRAEQAQQRSEARYRDLIEGSLQGVAIEQGGRLVFANETGARLLGYEKSDQLLADRQLLARQPHQTLRLLLGMRRDLQHRHRTDASARVEIRRADNSDIWLEILARRVDWRERPALQVTMIDVTKQVTYERQLETEKRLLTVQAQEMAQLAQEIARSKAEAEEARDMLKGATSVLAEGFALFDGNGRLVTCNQAFAEPYGRDPEDLQGRSIATLSRFIAKRFGLAGEAGSSWRESRVRHHRRADGTPFEFRLGERWCVVREHRTANGMVVVLRSDITHLKRTEEELRRFATVDMLTETYNRRFFTEQGTRLLERCIVDEAPAALILFDIDHFKQVNDSYGHETGDLALKEVSRICRRLIRPNDLLGRWGGEEFVILLPRTDAACAMTIAERIRQRIARMAIRTPHGSFSLTLSLGVANLSPELGDLVTLVARADQALYAAKDAGRNRVMDAAGLTAPADDGTPEHIEPVAG